MLGFAFFGEPRDHVYVTQPPWRTRHVTVARAQDARGAAQRSRPGLQRTRHSSSYEKDRGRATRGALLRRGMRSAIEKNFGLHFNCWRIRHRGCRSCSRSGFEFHRDRDRICARMPNRWRRLSGGRSRGGGSARQDAAVLLVAVQMAPLYKSCAAPLAGEAPFPCWRADDHGRSRGRPRTVPRCVIRCRIRWRKHAKTFSQRSHAYVFEAAIEQCQMPRSARGPGTLNARHGLRPRGWWTETRTWA